MTQPRPHTRDFSKKRPPVYFTIDDIRYDCFKALDLNQLAEFANLTRNLSEISRDLDDENELDVETARDAATRSTEAIDRVANLMKIVMKKASYVVFMTRLRPSEEDREEPDFEPIDYVQLLDIVRWLMEVYTGRPFKQSSTSSDGSETDDAGTSSTAGASLEELTPVDSIPATS